jgi:transposase
MALAMPGFHIEALDVIDEEYIIVARASSPTAVCPVCREETTAIHSQYERRPSDLPSSGLGVRLCLQVRRFFCKNVTCKRKIFCERLPQLAPVYARRTLRLTETLVYLAFALGAEVGACVVERLGMKVSRDRTMQKCRSRVFLLMKVKF